MASLPPGMHEHDGDAAYALGMDLGQLVARDAQVQRLDRVAIGIQAFVYFKDLFVQHFGQHDMAAEQAWAILIGNTQGVAKPSRGQQCGSFARSEEHTSELKSLMRISYAVFCLTQTMKQQ